MKTCYQCKYTLDYWLTKLPSRFCTKNWTKTDPNHKAIFFPIIRRTLPSKTYKWISSLKTWKWPFMHLKHVSLVPTNHITITKYIWIKITNKQHQNHARDIKSKRGLHVHVIWTQNWFFKLILIMNKPSKSRINITASTCIA